MPRLAKQPSTKTLVGDARKAVEGCAVWNARLTARRVTQFMAARMADAGLGVAQFGLVAQIAAAEDDTLGALAQRTGLDPSTLTRNLQVLEREGLIEIAAGASDLRRRAVWLTERGAQRLRVALPVWRKAHAELEKRLDVPTVLKVAKMTGRLADD
jgi:DNA-binding MarR family transcriptional regulator